jgi:hypothetical protein
VQLSLVAHITVAVAYINITLCYSCLFRMDGGGMSGMVKGGVLGGTGSMGLTMSGGMGSIGLGLKGGEVGGGTKDRGMGGEYGMPKSKKGGEAGDMKGGMSGGMGGGMSSMKTGYG